MSKTVEFFFDLGSPASYLAWTQLPALCARHGAALRYRPMLLGGVFQATGNASPVMIPAKGRYMFTDLARFAARYGVPFGLPPGFPINTLALMRGLVGTQLRAPERFDALLAALFNGLWVQRRNLGDVTVLEQVLAEAGFTAAEFQLLTGDEEVKAALKQATEEAVERGVFGAPTCFVDGQMYFGQDRLDFVADALKL
ncbi:MULTISPECIES: 2-hydroxychromene-2-carboxylate isomerase [Pseudomonas]|jgi:2-hydroxychromene-2-carboxylate isomerase|uniref:2-hydroxychromene-2-carboxylate isomerase n=1 Tax=Pseudomonas putida TaxID=303 RepID=A0A379KQY2_PSEPU|nr:MULTISPECIES: 2-hydroxychromene-2-carboxylate isomerase [Pseudomonas]QPN47737.1 2-hydroxychromene-2-carboxylate isomerase [Priestia aryabhattai]KAF1305288.1 disulfide bond formation protein DsbA [Pseudomonas sp. SG-MS2]MBG6128453.1 2-hydroxychromene-2-carboxylate isomerase [Pseudomonas sp. M2]NSX19603.1 2-hydroxychromene-2-carboxylate isomerase [Pseudomonas putida]NWC79628.1 2-hydroxychromene-2-carboxylate isomerase [Pseudomonas putida]